MLCVTSNIWYVCFMNLHQRNNVYQTISLRTNIWKYYTIHGKYSAAHPTNRPYQNPTVQCKKGFSNCFYFILWVTCTALWKSWLPVKLCGRVDYLYSFVEKLTCFHSFFISSRVSSSACSRVAATLIPSSRVINSPNSNLKILRRDEPELGVMSKPITWPIWERKENAVTIRIVYKYVRYSDHGLNYE